MGRTNAAAYCRRLFPGGASATDSTPEPQAEPVDITPQLNALIEAWKNRPRPPAGTPPAHPLAVIPDIQAACAAYAGAPERWRRCAADGWRATGLKGQPPLVLQAPPTPPPVEAPSPVQPDPPVQQQPPPPPTKPKPKPEPVSPSPIIQAETPVAIAPTSPIPAEQAPAPPPAIVAPPQPPPPVEIPWPWLVVVAVVAAGAGGFGLARWLGRARPSTRTSQAAPCDPPRITLVADPGVVVLTPDGPPRAGLAVSMRVEVAAGEDAVCLDYPSLETAP